MPNNNSRGRSSGGSRRGFAAMDADKQREISAKGGRASGSKRARAAGSRKRARSR